MRLPGQSSMPLQMAMQSRLGALATPYGGPYVPPPRMRPGVRFPGNDQMFRRSRQIRRGFDSFQPPPRLGVQPPKIVPPKFFPQG